MKPSHQLDEGSVTAEFAILLPLAVALLGAVIAFIGVQAQLAQTSQEMASIARAVEAGPGSDDWKRLAKEFDVQVEAHESGNLVCLSLRKSLSILGLGQFPVNQQICALPVGR